MPCSCSRCIRSWTPANRSHSPQRSRPTCGCSSGHGSASWPATARSRARRSAGCWRSAGSASRGPRPARRGRRARPSARLAGKRPPAASAPAMPAPRASRRRGRPPARRSSRPRRRAAGTPPPGRCSTIAGQRRGHRRRAGRAVSPAVPGRHRRRTSRRTLMHRPSSMPRQAATTSGAPGFQCVDPARSPRPRSQPPRYEPSGHTTSVSHSPPGSGATGGTGQVDLPRAIGRRPSRPACSDAIQDASSDRRSPRADVVASRRGSSPPRRPPAATGRRSRRPAARIAAGRARPGPPRSATPSLHVHPAPVRSGHGAARTAARPPRAPSFRRAARRRSGMLRVEGTP